MRDDRNLITVSYLFQLAGDPAGDARSVRSHESDSRQKYSLTDVSTSDIATEEVTRRTIPRQPVNLSG